MVDGTFDARPFLAVVSDLLSDRAEQSAATGDAAAVLEQLATGATSPEVDGVGPMDEDITTGLNAFRKLTLALALTPAGSILGNALGPAVTTVGSIAGSGTVWTLFLAALVPPAVLVAVRARRGQRESSTITS